MTPNQFNAATPVNQMHQSGPNFCPYCDFWHPVSSITGDHVERTHPDRVVQPPKIPTEERLAQDAAARAEKIAAMRARKAERDAKRAAAAADREQAS